MPCNIKPPTTMIRPLIAALCLSSPILPAQEVNSESWGKSADGSEVLLYTLRNTHGHRVRILTLGATLTGVDVPDRDGRLANVTLHLDDRDAYLQHRHPVFGSTIGRYANRLDKGGFTIDGTRFDLESVNPATGVHIHGGKTGFQKQNWAAEPVRGDDFSGVRLSLTSPDGHEGFPGTVRAVVTYQLNNRNELSIDYSAVTDKPTHVSLTNHAYWNLGGAGSGTVFDNRLLLKAGSILEFDKRQVPTGALLPVEGTPFDFRASQAVGARIGQVPGGYDHCFVLDPAEHGGLRLVARVEHPASGRVMEVLTTTPGLQLYTANHLSDSLGAGGKKYGKHHALCLECQHFPDSPNHPDFPTTLLRPGQTYRQTTIHRFSVAGREA